jgi:hypothetical protein
MPAEWLQHVPEDLRNEASLAQIQGKDWSEAGPALAKSYVNAQKLIGQNRIPAPQQNWGEKEWDGLFSQLGRPEKPDAYKFPDGVQLPNGLKLDEEKFAKAREVFHKSGLLPKQAEAVMKYYAESLASQSQAEMQRQEAEHAAAVNKLRTELGDKYDEGVDLARSVVRQFGSPELIEFLNTSKLGDHPEMIRALMKVGKAMSEDTSRGSGSGPGFVSNATAAKQEVSRLSGDAEFQKILQDRSHPGHKDALARWEHTFKLAYSGKSE